MNTVLRLGLLGTARINRRLIPSMQSSRRVELAAVASRDHARATAYAQEWRIPVAHASYDALLRDSAIDAVYIPLPNTLHVEWTLRALDAGKHVLCEKPLALSPDDVDRVAVVAAARRRVVTEAFMYRHQPLMARLRELLAEGTIGQVQSVAAGFTFLLDRPHDVRHDPHLGGGALWDIGCYPVDLARLLLGEPLEAFGWAAHAERGVDHTFTGLLRFQHGVVASVHSSFRAPYRTWLEVAGSRGLLRVANVFRPDSREPIEIVTPSGHTREMVAGASDPYARQLEDFVAAALDARPPGVTLASSRGNAAALLALRQAAERGEPVQL